MSAISETLSEIREVNLSYLLLAQRLLREDKAAAVSRMGISNELADLLANLSVAQTAKLAASNQLLCRFRFDDHTVLSSLADKGKPDGKRAGLAPARTAIALAAPSTQAMS
jgi:flagellar transcriptional activator FlhD